MGVGPMTRWKHDEAGRLVKELWIPFLLSIVAAIAGIFFLPVVTSDSLLVPLGLGLAAWVLFSHLAGLWERLRHKRGLKTIAADLGKRRAQLLRHAAGPSGHRHVHRRRHHGVQLRQREGRAHVPR